MRDTSSGSDGKWIRQFRKRFSYERKGYTRFVRVACSNMLLLPPTVAPTHATYAFVRVNRSYVEHVEACRFNES